MQSMRFSVSVAGRAYVWHIRPDSSEPTYAMLCGISVLETIQADYRPSRKGEADTICKGCWRKLSPLKRYRSGTLRRALRTLG